MYQPILIKLDFCEKICNDKKCCDPNTDATFSIGSETSDMSFLYLIIIALIIILVIVGIAFFMMKKKQDGEAKKNGK